MNSIRYYLRSLDWIQWAVLVAVAVTVFTATYYHVTSAACYGGTRHGRTCYRGYFDNVDDRGGSDVLPVISGGQAIPRSSVNSADSLYNLLRAAYNSNDAQRKTGAAFVYNTMMYNRAVGTGRGVSNAEWLELRDRLRGLDNAGKIAWGGNINISINSYWQGTDGGFNPDGVHNDDAFFRNNKNEPGIRIRDYNNQVIYEILRRCANPDGDSRGGLPPVPAVDYALTPHVNSISPSSIEAGSKVSVAGSVDNVGDVASKPTQWEITQINVKPGKRAPHENENGTTSGQAPCQRGGGAASGSYFYSSDADCKRVGNGSGVFNLGRPAQNLKPSAPGIGVGDLPVGTRVCFALSVQPRSNSSTEWAHSKPICTVVGKKPKLQIWGGDVSVRGKIETSTSLKDQGGTKTFGSWVEYGAFSVGTNSRFASGSGTNGGNVSNNQDVWSNLTFANTVGFGNYTTLASFPPLPGVSAFFEAVKNTLPIVPASVDIGSLTFDTGSPVQVRTRKAPTGNLTITGGNIPPGKSVVIIAEGTVTIDGNINYTNAMLSRPKDIPQVVIIAANINIKDSVTRVDSWLVAGGKVDTCYNFPGKLTSGKCNAVLEVNGPVVTNKLVLNRTAGSGAGLQSGDPAERFNLRPDAFLWAQLQAAGSNKAQTVYSAELSPRF